MKIYSALVGAMTVVILAGCSSPMTYEQLNHFSNTQDQKMVAGNVKYPSAEELKVPQGQAIVFLRYHQNLGEDKEATHEDTFIHVRIVDLASNKIKWSIPRQYKGFFPKPPVGDYRDLLLWLLPPGEYSLLDVQGVRTRSTGLATGRQEMTRRIDGKFKVQKAGEIVYLGDLDILGSPTEFNASVTDKYGEAINEFHRTYVNAKGEDRNAAVHATPTR
jgi:hypothetical protein